MIGAAVRNRPILAGALALFLLLAACYSFSVSLRASYGASITADEPFYLLTSQSILDDGNLDLREQYDRESYRSFFDYTGEGLWKQSVPTNEGRLLSPHEPGTSLLVLPGFALAGLRGVQYELVLIAALTFALAYVLTATETKAPLASWLVTAAVGLSATAFIYSSEIYPEVPAALCLISGLLALRFAGEGLRAGLLLAVLLSLLAWFGEKYVPLGGVIATFYLVGGFRRPEGLQLQPQGLQLRGVWGGRVVFLAAVALSGLAYIWFHLTYYDHLTAYSVNTVYEGASTLNVLDDHVAFGDRFYRLYGLFIDRRFGLGHWTPLFLLVLPSLPLLATRGRAGAAVLLIIGMQIGIATFVAITMMGFWFPGRTLMAVLPLFPLVLTTLALRSGPAVRWLMAGLAGYSLVTTALLWQVARGPSIRLAVNPWEMASQVFRAPARLFPNYQTWSNETVALTAVWLVAGAVATLAINWPEVRGLALAGGARLKNRSASIEEGVGRRPGAESI